MGRTACTELQCLYKGALYFYLICITSYWKNLTSESAEETGPKIDIMLKQEFVCFFKSGFS
jgi:hypothetical protein